jgi:hypothetical protein
MLRSFTVLDPHFVNSIRENPRYTKMTPEEILGKFVSGRMMIKEARYVDDALNGCHTRFQRAESGASHMCARIYFHTYVDVTSVIYQKNNA